MTQHYGDIIAMTNQISNYAHNNCHIYNYETSKISQYRPFPEDVVVEKTQVAKWDPIIFMGGRGTLRHHTPNVWGATDGQGHMPLPRRIANGPITQISPSQ